MNMDEQLEEIITEADLLTEPEVREISEEELARIAEKEQLEEELRKKHEAMVLLETQAKEVNKARIIEEARQQLLKDRFANLVDAERAMLQLGKANAVLYFNQFIMAELNKDKAELKLKKLEEMDKSCEEALVSAQSLQIRKQEYLKIDKLLLEGLAEQAAGNDTKLKLYLEQREEIRKANPKV